MDLNRATIIGRLTRDLELRNTPTGRSVTSFGVATNRVWRSEDGQKQEQVEFHNVVLWGKLAEVAAQYLRKGRRVYIEGRLQTREWTGQDGLKRRTTEIVGDNMIMLDSPGGSSGAGGANQPRPYNQDSAPVDSQELPVINASAPADVIEEEIKVEDIPF